MQQSIKIYLITILGEYCLFFQSVYVVCVKVLHETWICGCHIILTSQRRSFYAYHIFTYFRIFIPETFQYWQCNAYIKVFGLHSFALKFPEDGTPVPKHVRVLLLVMNYILLRTFVG
jgi:hypothetical protein